MRGSVGQPALALTIAAVLGGSLGGPEAKPLQGPSAGRATGAIWRSPTIVIRPAVVRSRRLSTTDIARAARAAALAWRQTTSCAVPTILIGPSAQGRGVARDGINVLVVRDDTWCLGGDPKRGCYDPDSVAMTSVYRNGREAEGGGDTIVEADIELNFVHHRWARIVDGLDPRGVDHLDLQNALAHEFGHVLGLSDNCVEPRKPQAPERPSCFEAIDDVREATMYPLGGPGQITRRTITTFDRRASCDLYDQARDGSGRRR